MTDKIHITIGDILLDEVERSQYFQLLYEKLLTDYTLFLFAKPYNKFTVTELKDILKFADILSKSNVTKYKSRHKKIAQDIVVTLTHIYKEKDKEREIIDVYAREVLLAISNYIGVTKLPISSTPYLREDVVSNLADGYRILGNETTTGEFLLDSQKVALQNAERFALQEAFLVGIFVFI